MEKPQIIDTIFNLELNSTQYVYHAESNISVAVNNESSLVIVWYNLTS